MNKSKFVDSEQKIINIADQEEETDLPRTTVRYNMKIDKDTT